MLVRVHLNGAPIKPRTLLVTLSAPGAGNNWSYTVPQAAGNGLILESATYVITTSATVTNRWPRLRVQRGGSVLGKTGAAGVTAAGQQTTNFWNKGAVNNSFTSVANLAPMPILPVLVAGDVIDSAVINLVAGDTLTTPVLLFSFAG